MKRLFLLLSLLLIALPAAAQDDPALLLFAHADINADAVDFLVDDEVSGAGWFYGRMSAPLPGPYSDTVSLDPGVHVVAAQSNGTDLANPVKVNLSAGSRTLVILTPGELTVYDLDTLAPRPTDTTSPWYYINALDETLDVTVADELVIDDLEPFAAATYDASFVPFDEIATAGDNPDEIFWQFGPSFDFPIYGEPLYTAIIIAVREPDGVFSVFSDATGPVLEQLRLLNAAEIPESSARTYMKAIETSGIEDDLAAGDSVVYIIPGDMAFNTMDAAARDAAFADEQALADLLRYHTIDANDFPSYANLPANGESFTYETRQGGTVTVTVDEFTIFVNDVRVNLTIPATNGLQVRVGEVLTPPN